MTFPEKRLRAADPARALPPQPDARAEHDLGLLLAPSTDPARVPERAEAPRRPRAARRGPILTTALVAAVVVAVSITVLTLPHLKTDTAATPGPSACATTGEEALLCGTFRSTGGTGALAFLTTRPYTLAFTREAGLTMLLEGDCDTFQFAVRLTGSTFEVGDGGASQSGCSADARRDHQRFADELYSADVTYRLQEDVLTFHFRDSEGTATFIRTDAPSTGDVSRAP